MWNERTSAIQVYVQQLFHDVEDFMFLVAKDYFPASRVDVDLLPIYYHTGIYFSEQKIWKVH